MATVPFALVLAPYLVEGARVLRVYVATRPTKKHMRAWLFDPLLGRPTRAIR